MITVDHPARAHNGIYFSMDHQTYLEKLALSAHGVMNMRISIASVSGDSSPYDFWVRCPALNPNYDEDVADESDSDAKILGDAYECRVILGPEEFYRRYAPELDKRDYPAAVRTNEEIIARIIEAGGPTKTYSGFRKEQLIEILKQYDPGALIWETLLRGHAAEHEGKTMLDHRYLWRIERAAAMIEHDPGLKYAFTGGMPKVAVFWEDPITGVPMKCEMDYLKERVPGTFSILDNKSFANASGLPIDRATDRAKSNYRYPLQAVTYLEGAMMARELAAKGLVFGEVAPAFVRALAACEKFEFVWIWQQKGPAPVARAEVWCGTAVNEKIELDLAKQLFATCWEQHGADTPWVHGYRLKDGRWLPSTGPRMVSDSDLPITYR